MHRIAVLARQGVMPLELGLVHQIFGAAKSADGRRLYEITTCAPTVGALRTNADFCIEIEHGPEVIAAADTVVVPASHELDDGPDGSVIGPDVAAALARIRPGTRIASICTGSFLLASAGLLDDRPATTHWQSAERFRALFPRVRLDADVLYTDDGEVLTSAGEASGIDLCLHMIRRDHGSAVANAVARSNVVPPHRDGGQAQYISYPVREPERSSTTEARRWALEHLDRPLNLRELAEREAMSVRTFTRRFREEVGTSPGQWLAQRRLDRARQLLEETDLSIESVAARAGFGTATSLRSQLHGALGVSPRAYRRTFRVSTAP
ncbi:GlxA family transcriptional regulator [Solicola gregarius]|uniref:Helix-turn-helix domain-containing protein n=1 Tax=Solicola gregarius TaxID=2908642 RepID=A0AA46TL02_9ACTN|nr:helix-turn-helix domain-containing protein [Solicola gregarius]UYM07254.1 helix-turn-helix domain-containing protein [Solicola gregarius]